jgi:cytochrome c
MRASATEEERMRKDLAIPAAGMGLAIAVAFAADPGDGQALVTTNGCFACHSADRKIVGPAYREIAAKYLDDGAAEAALVRKIKTGGKGVWGDVPMPPHPHLKDEDARTMVRWILSIR